jgi:membrane protein implicated in regulation of membrane protease activity
LGRSTVEEFVLAGRLWFAGSFCVILFLILFVVATSANQGLLAGVSVALAFATYIPLIGTSVYLLTRVTRSVVHRYGLPRSARRSLKPRMLNNPEKFDEWLANQKALVAA